MPMGMDRPMPGMSPQMPGMPAGGMRPMGAPGVGGNPQDVAVKLKQNMSIFNPTDGAAMKQEGMIRPNMTIREFFQGYGVDVDGPVTQLLQFAKGQIDKAQPLNKMAALSGQPPMGQGASPAPQGLPAEPGMAGLLGNIRR